MRFVPTRIHGILDYVIGIILIISPWLLGFSRVAAAQWVAIVLGIILILYSLFTDYEVGLVRTIPMPTHLVLDIIGGIILAISPWLFAFAALVWVPHLVIGLIEIVLSLVTERVPAHAAVGGLT
mgnify:FL=1